MLFCSLYMFEKFYNYSFMLLRAWTGRTGPFISFRHNCVTTVPARLLPRCLHLFCKGTHLCESLTVLTCLSTLEGQTSSTLSSAQIQPLLRRSLCSANSPLLCGAIPVQSSVPIDLHHPLALPYLSVFLKATTKQRIAGFLGRCLSRW